ncbi:MAG TPA: efflux RND transporter periplasmic adaptor subunit [Telluria sp.]|nr:efflux RND transporter periplasmic adaptor subunit [Telluria sp.]
MTSQKVGASLLCSFILTLCLGAAAGERQDKFPVSEQQLRSLGIEVTALRRDAEAVTLSLPAQVSLPTGAEQIVSAPLAGMAVQLFVQPNDAVKPGDPLMRIASPELGTLQLQLMQAASRHGLARSAARREQALFDEGIIARRRVEEASGALAEADAVLRQAKAALRLGGMSPASIARVAAGGKPEEGITLHASRAAIVTAIEVRAGQRVEPATALMHLAQAGRYTLEIQAPAADIGAWKIGSRLQLQGRRGTARVTSISPVVNSANQTVMIRADLAAGVDARAGEVLTVQLPLPADADTFDLPLSALVRDGKATFVFARSVNGFEAREVSVLQNAGQRVRIKGQLKAGDKVAVSGVVALKGSWLGEKGGE